MRRPPCVLALLAPAFAGKVVGNLCKRGASFSHRAVAAVGDAEGGEETQEDTELERGVDGDAAEAAEIGWDEDAEADQQRREPAKHGDRGAGRNRRLPAR